MEEMNRVLNQICQAISSKKGEDITILDVREIASFTDYFVICQGQNRKQNQAICDAIVQALKTGQELSPFHREGYQHAEWILLDYIDFVVHIFSSQARGFYKLERLWSDGVEVEPAILSA